MHPKLSSILSRLLIDRSGGHRAKVLEAFRSKVHFDELPAEERERDRMERLAHLLNHARRRIPRFRALPGLHDSIEATHAKDALAAFPVMTRSEIQSNPTAFLAAGSEPLFDDATGGSTGTPMRFKVDRATQIARESSLYWADHLAGWKYGERIAMLWGSDRDLQNASGQIRFGLRWFVDNRRWYNAFDMGEAQMEVFHRKMMRFKPHIIVAYAGSMDVYARFLEKKGIRPAYPARAMVSSAEMLTPTTRRKVESVFEKPVFDRYGNREFGAIATECSEHVGLHVNESDFILEIDGPDPWRQPGRLLVTYLRNTAMPFVRYDTGDLARFKSVEPCACGRSSLRLASIAGRSSDTIRTASGKLIHGEFFTHLLYSAKQVREFQFIQESLTRYRLLLVADRREEDEVETGWRRQIADEVGDYAELSIEYVNDIPELPSGKRKFTVSLIADTD